jgi:hypothetical protein
MPIESVRCAAAVVAGHFYDLATCLFQATLDLFDQHPPEAESLGFLRHYKYGNAAHRSGAVDGHHSVQPDESNDLFVERCDDGQFISFAERLQVLADMLLVDLVAKLGDELDDPRRIGWFGVAQLG